MEIIGEIANELKIKEIQVKNTVELIDNGNTIPFIARYRKEVTGGLTDEQLRNLFDRLIYLRNLEHRKKEVTRLIDEQGKLTKLLTQDIEKAVTLSELEDIYRPYKQKKKTRATIAKAKGLEPLADIIFRQEAKEDILIIAKEYINEENGVKTEQEAIQGAQDIIAENISDNAVFRKKIKSLCFREAIISTKASKEEKSSYEMYYDYSEPILKIPSHRILAINRGETEEYLKVKIEKPEEKILNLIRTETIKSKNTQFVRTFRRNHNR